jgi:integrase/recombinase XerD
VPSRCLGHPSPASSLTCSTGVTPQPPRRHGSSQYDGFSAWLTDEGEQDSDPLLGLKAPKLDTRVVEPLTDDQLQAWLTACSGPDMRGRRDEALVRLMAETGARAGEVAALALTDVDLTAGIAVVRRGKGSKGRVIPFGPQTARAIDRYIRSRAPTGSRAPQLCG